MFCGDSSARLMLGLRVTVQDRAPPPTRAGWAAHSSVHRLSLQPLLILGGLGAANMGTFHVA